MDNAQSAGDDSDNDVVTDFLNSNCNSSEATTAATTATVPAAVFNGGQHSVTATVNAKSLNQTPRVSVESQNYCIPIINAPASASTPAPARSNNNNHPVSNSHCASNNNNMIPTINVTPHSPASASKYNNIFEDTLSQLQNIRETVVQMKNSSQHMQDGLSNYGLLNAAILSASLPDLSGGNGAGSGGGTSGPHYVMWSTAPQQCLLNTDRRKSWTTVDDASVAGDCTNKSVSLSSLDSEEQETIRVTEQRRRSARNSTGGISTHSLNEAELARDFERIAAKRSLATEIISRIPLQKSISTSSIIAKEDIKAIARHLTDSEDENQSLLRAHAKIEVYDNVEKRRKRGSLFFRKKKDKAKMKSIGGQFSACDVCGAQITLAQIKEHQLECKLQSKRLMAGAGMGGKGQAGQDYYDGNDAHALNDDTPLIRAEFLNEPPIEAHDLGADPMLGIVLKEHDSWTPGVPKDLLKTLKELQIKRQEHIYEFIMTEKHHCQTLLVMQKVFVESLERHFPAFNIHSMFPRLQQLTDLHTCFLRQLREKQREQPLVDTIADILLDFFSLEQAQCLRLAYGEFCANHRTALEQFKQCLNEPNFAEWYKHCLQNPLLKKKGIPECILFVTQRLTKYPLLIEPLLKSARDNKLETDKLQHALNLVKSLLVDVDACVAEKELRERQLEIYARVDAKSFAIYKNKPFRKTELGVESRRRLKFEGLATLMQGRAKTQLVLVVVLTDCLCFLSENSAHNKYTFFTPEHKAGVVPLQKLLIREKAGTESRGIYIISSNPDFPEMYELKVQTPKDKHIWIQSIRQAVLDCPATDIIEAEDLTAEEKLRIGVNKRETIEKMRQKDIEQALLLEEKLMLQLNLMKEHQHFSATPATNGQPAAMSAANFLAAFGSYKELVNADCDTTELWRRVLNTVQDISQLAATIYTAATGLPVSRTVSSVGEKQSDNYNSPTLPKRAETFAGFDEKRGKLGAAFPCRDATKLATLQVLSPRLQELEEKRELKTTATPMAVPEPPQLHASTVPAAIDASALKEYNYAVLQVSHHLHTLLCIISQQMTTIQSLQLQLALYRESPRSAYTHNDQLEELRNLQDKLQEEKTAWLRQKEQQEQELAETRAQQLQLQQQIKAEQEDVRQQREQLYRKMELLSSQGLLLSPSTTLPIASPTLAAAVAVAAAASATADDSHETDNGAPTVPTTATTPAGTVDRRKDKWRTASTISKTPPVNLHSATNAPKANAATVKQKLPMKLSSLSSTTSSSATRIDKSASFNNSSPNVGVQQLFPLKLADKRQAAVATPTSTAASPSIVPQHSRTGSSPAIIQQTGAHTPTSTGGISRADSAATQPHYAHHVVTPHQRLGGQTPTSSRNMSSRTNITPVVVPSGQAPRAKPEEEEIYF
ncbi:rho guanine nucleotide exchange factor 18 [Scaptodrosophila lebanonensis]|uniref:Rho guanine nucleotide exchange factor 18 n=1 Tax=Drosophila lebanonensis TaxID=7225 RepID=A0A6J2TL76_DROLE|nr:rho guanine nucleotide exchange factor 18 [Scaptodrosophila lebanonensis]XP_030377339.1 rho guanine nucleotide exchange factor 18 [Scaptodrosophila lebanonensis]XP_030377341.1 rho guanine nucleotide exchange factor 18 [Scaptodrosophila lebanonensis]